LIAVAAAVARSIKRELDKVDEPARLRPADATPGTGRRVASWTLNRLLPWLASAALIAIGVGAALLWIAAGAATGFTLSQLWPVIAALAIMLLGRIALDVNGSSLHNLFRWRLAATYAITRSAAQVWYQRPQELFDQGARARLSDLRSDQGEPTLVIGATANINANREVVPGRGGFSLAFDRHKLTLRGDPIGPMADEPNVAAETTDYEHLLGHTRLTLSDLIAISGAPLSPRMRAMADRGAYRLLLILTNMRLGVWMPHPEVVRRARSYLDMPPEYRQKDRWWVRRTWLLLLWYQAPHPWWHRDPWKQQEAMMRQGDRETRLWAHVLELRQRSTEGDSNLLGAFARLRAALCWRMMQPTLALLWAEAVGRTSSRATWIKVSDGDRHDNLGLVEALQRGSRNIMVLDAGGDHPGTWRTVGRAISLARSAGFEINLDPVTTLASDGEPGRGTTPPNDEVTQPWARGTFTWPQYNDYGQSQHGHIVVCKLGWWKSAPSDIRARSGDNPDYPYETTLSQLYDSADVEPYQRLGASAIIAAMHDLANCDMCSPR